MQRTSTLERFWTVLLVAGLLFLNNIMAATAAVEAADKLSTGEQREQKSEPVAPPPSGSPSGDKETRSKEVEMLRDLYVDCLTVANYARNYLSEELLSPEEGDKICGEIADKSRSILELMQFSATEIESFFEEARQKARQLLEDKFPNREKKPKKTVPDTEPRTI